MKRKVVQIAGFTKVVSLPSEWVKAHGINKGDDLEVRSEGNQLVISQSSDDAIRRANLDLSRTDKFMGRFIDLYYRLGYDELEIKTAQNWPVTRIQQEITSDLLGFEVVENTSDICRLRNMSKGSEEEFEIILRRIILMLVSMSKDGLEVIKSREKEKIDGIMALKRVNNKFINYCLRNLNKYGHPEKGRANMLYQTITSLSLVADCFIELFEAMKEQQKKPNAGTLELFELINGMVTDFHKLFYDFKTDRLVEFDRKWVEIKIKKDTWYKSMRCVQDATTIHNLINIGRQLHHLSENIIGKA